MTTTSEPTVLAAYASHRGRKRLGERELLAMIAAIMALMALAIDLMLPAFSDIRERFGLAEDSDEVTLTLTMFFIGLAAAQVVWGPLADRYGRKIVLYFGMGVYIAGGIGSALSPSLNWLLASRFIWGVGAAGSRVVATAIIRDSFSGEKMAKAMSQIMAVFVMAPVFAPMLGAGLISIFHYSSVFWFCVVWSFVIIYWTRRLPETLDPANVRPLEFKSVLAGFRAVMKNRITAGYTIATMFLQGVFTTYLGSSERIIEKIFGREGQFPYVFGAVAVLFGVAALINSQIVGRFGMTKIIHFMLGLVVATSTLLLLITMAGDGTPNFWIFMPIMGLILSMFMFLMPNLNTGALDPMGEIAGTASSLTGAIRIAGGAVLGRLVDKQIGDSLTPFVVFIVIFLVAAVLSVLYAERGVEPQVIP